MDWERWALAQTDLLDRIEAVADDEEAVRVLCRGRFELAEQHGLTVEFLGPHTGYDQ